MRLAVAAALLLLAMEVGYVVFGGSHRHVWDRSAFGPVPAELSARPVSWGGLLAEKAWETGRVLLIGVPAWWIVGYAWGMLGARARRFRVARLLAAPFAAFACAPGFWFVTLVAVYAYFHWQRPGFANDLVLESGPNLLAWWHAAVVALPATAAAIAWQIAAVAGALEREATRPWVRGLFALGCDDREIFYGSVLRRGVPALVEAGDRALPAFLGSVVILESAFRYDGLGAMFVQSVKLASYSGIFLGGMGFASLALAFAFVREVLFPPIDR